MAATVVINRLTGTAPTETDITTGATRASTADNPTPGTATPIPVPTSGSNYSYWVSTQLNCTAAPDNALNNIKWYTDGGNGLGTGITMYVSTASTYIQATGTSGSSGVKLALANYSTLIGEPSNAFAYTTGAKLTVPGNIAATTGSFGSRVVFQLSVDTTAGAGNSGSETLSFNWDET